MSAGLRFGPSPPDEGGQGGGRLVMNRSWKFLQRLTQSDP